MCVRSRDRYNVRIVAGRGERAKTPESELRRNNSTG